MRYEAITVIEECSFFQVSVDESDGHRALTRGGGDGLDRAVAHKLVARLGVGAKLGFKVHPHMLRHACGFQLANQGTDTRTLQAYLGHRNIQHRVRYTELSPTRFKNL
jgi:site-specific recombinase XerD